MSRLVLTGELLAAIKGRLRTEQNETCAVLFGRAVFQRGKLARIVAREVRWIEPQEYRRRSDIHVELQPQVVAEVAQRARRSGESIIFVHNHPLALNKFSETDDAGERALAEFFSARTPDLVHASLLITPEVMIARILGNRDSLQVAGIGPTLEWGKEEELQGSTALTFDRQARVFGQSGQSRLKMLRIAIVGLGGTGSLVLEQLAHLGVGQLVLVDADTVEPSNLNRVVGASAAEVGRPKAEVARDLALRINPAVHAEACIGSILLDRFVKDLTDVDLVFGCTDTHGSRAVLNQFAYQYLVPVIDMGVVIAAGKGGVSHIAGRTQMLSAGLGCLLCGNLLNPEAVRVDLLTDFERQTDPYVVGILEPAPSVISLNATMASLAVTMFLSATVGIPSAARLVNYDGMAGTLRPAVIGRHSKCVVCSDQGALARATEWPLPARLS